MSKDGHCPITVEYFCFENDDIWNRENEFIIDLALNELKIIFDKDFKIIHSAVTRSPKAYPVIKTGYQEYINNIKDWLSTLNNVTAIGRSGMFKYNNQDHAMATGIYAARTLLGEGIYDPWEVNVDGEYHEEIVETN
jgi:protoporphyrinogen oxidase